MRWKLTATILMTSTMVLDSCTADTSSPEGDAPSQQVCSSGKWRCFARRTGAKLYAGGGGLGATDLIAAYKLDHLEPDAGEHLPPVNSGDLDGCPACPYCENPVAGACACGTLFCLTPKQSGPVVCPSCRAQLTLGGGGPFDVRRSAG